MEAVKAAEAKDEAAEAEGETAAPADSFKPMVTLDLSTVPNAKKAKLDIAAASSFASAGVTVTVNLPAASVTLAPDALAEIAKASAPNAPATTAATSTPDAPAGTSTLDASAGTAATSATGTTPVTIEAAAVPVSALTAIQPVQGSVYETAVNINIFVGTNKINVPAEISMPYTLKPNENPNAVSVWYLTEDGSLTKLSGVYDAASGRITFSVQQQGCYVAGYDPAALS